MHYKTIVLHLIEQNPGLHERLRAERSMLQTVTEYALALKESHLHWIEQLTTTNPASDPRQISGEAMEIAVSQLQETFSQAFSPSENGQAFRLDEAMAFLRRHTPPE